MTNDFGATTSANAAAASEEHFGGGHSRRSTQGSGIRQRRPHDNIGDLVDAQIAMRASGDVEDYPMSGGGGGSYRPSFTSRREASLLPSASNAKELVDINTELENRIRPPTFQTGRRSSGVHIGDMEPGQMVPKQNKGGGYSRGNNDQAYTGRNAMVQIGAPPVQQQHQQSGPTASFRRSISIDHHAGGGMMLSKTSPLPLSRPLDTGHRQRKMSLGLTYGPTPTDDLHLHTDNTLTLQAMSHKRRVNANATKHMGMEGHMMMGGGHGRLHAGDASLVDEATQRVQNRSGRHHSGATTADSGYNQDHSPPGGGGHARVGPAVMGPNTLTLDNWFTSMNSDATEDPNAPYPGHSSSQPSSRRHSQSETRIPSPSTNQGPTNRSSGHDHLHVGLTDVDESEHGGTMIMHAPKSAGHRMPKGGAPFSLELATSLKMLLFGATNRSFPHGWIGQSFNFNNIPSLRFGFLQEKGGPCGVLAAVNAYLIQALVFGNRLDDTTKAVHPLSPTDKERNRALASALASILHKCSSKTGNIVFVLPSKVQHFSGVGRYKNDGITESLTIYEYQNAREALAFAQDNVTFYSSGGNHAVIAFLYSVLLTRGFANIRDDMDSPDLPLMAAHGYCSQEMVSLLLCGKAVSNTFDNVVHLEGTTRLQGFEERSEIGLLSLFEHYKSCSVGENLKTPQFPIWLVCSESHFTVLFSEHRGTEKAGLADRLPIGLNYYDGLYKLDHLIVLTVDCSKTRAPEDSNLVPPLEHCIRTKWRDALIDWNGSEKIL